MTPFEIIKSARLTEKGSIQAERYNQYTIVADARASKPNIKRAVEELFNVKVTDISTQQVRGKRRRQRTHQAGIAPKWKKAILTLKRGDKISLT